MQTSSMMEVYNVEYPDKSKLEEVCRLKQPTKFTLNIIDGIEKLSYGQIVTNHPEKNIYIRKNIMLDSDNKYVPIKINQLKTLCNGNEKYFSENNYSLIESIEMDDWVRNNITSYSLTSICICNQ